MNQARLIRITVAASLFVNAFLVFILQPHISKRLLPVLGGSAEVWIVCSLFFQFSLLGGYAAAYVARRLPFSTALALHIGLLAIAWLLWPFSAGDGPPQGAVPTWWTLRTLSGQVGLLLIALTATSPLLQYAYARALPTLDPYPLFSASNAGSVAGLFAYPLIVEPLLTLDQQTRAWSACALALLLLLAVTAAGLIRVSAGAVLTPLVPAPPITVQQRLRWMVLSLVPSVLLLSVTALITTDIAPMPLLWIVPLGVYLGSFVRVFAAGWQPWRWTWPILALLSLFMLMTFGRELSQMWYLGIHLTILWCASVTCHGALVEERPAPAGLSEFYLWMAVGGAIGGCLAGLVAPVTFSVRAEYPLAVLAALWLAPRHVGFRSQLRFTWGVAATSAAVALLPVAYVLWNSRTLAPTRVVMLVAAVVAATLWHRPRLFAGLATIALTALVIDGRLHPGDVVLRGRTFYGTHSVRDLPESQGRALFHGTTLHGLQSLRPEHRSDPLSYYGRNSPLADVFRARSGHAGRVAVVGLGAGVILRYAQPGSAWTVYEIDPAIARLAQDSTLFSHWSEAAGSPKLVIGDGRLRLRDAADASYDLIVADAFASDSVPVHLLTREALELYQRKLRDDGAVLFNISNRYLDLAPALGATAARLGLLAYYAADETDDKSVGLFPSSWILVGRASMPVPTTGRWTLVVTDPREPGWTDDHSNVLEAFRPILLARKLFAAHFAIDPPR